MTTLLTNESPDEGNSKETSKDYDKCNVNTTDDELYLKSLKVKLKHCIIGPPIVNYHKVYAKVSANADAGIVPAFISREDSFMDKIQLVPQNVHVNSSINRSFPKKRKLKFVPYEPYKACVRPISYGVDKSANNLQKITVASENKGNEIMKLLPKKFQRDEPKEKVVDGLKSEIRSLKNEIVSLNQILSTQSQVNSDLKKLLVASLGEDVQEKVQCLTEERARMAKMIRKYSEKVDVDYEEKERILIQCDIWKSKFHASSLILDDLRDTNSAIINHVKQAGEALKMLLEERNVAYPLLRNAYKHTYQVQEAFDPFHSECPSGEVMQTTDSVSLSVTLSSLAENIRNRLVGSLGLVTRGVTLLPETKTPGENVALQAIKDCNNLLVENAGLCMAKRSISGSNFSIDKRITFNCCAQCNGDVCLV